MPQYIRVRAKDTGHEMSIRADRFDADAFTKLDRPALDAHGEIEPVKYRTSVTKQATEKKAGQTAAESEKEN